MRRLNRAMRQIDSAYLKAKLEDAYREIDQLVRLRPALKKLRK
jgi:hypothetical protein